METVREIAKVPTDINDKPRLPVHVFDCGQLDLATGLIKREIGNSSIFDQDKKINQQVGQK